MTIRIAVIGAGIMGRDHAAIVAGDLPGACLQVLCDASADRAKAVADETGAIDVATDPFAVIARRDVDAVLVASPDSTHAPLTIAAVAAGKPVLCEKPLAQASTECLRIMDAETRAGRHLIQVGFMRRFDPSYREMKRVLTDGKIGRPLMMHNLHRAVAAPADFTGHMAITNAAPHEFDIGRFLLDTEIRAISGFEPTVVDASRPCAPVLLVLETVAGPLIDIEVNVNAAYGYDVRSELVGESGTVSLIGPVHSRLNSSLAFSESYLPDWRVRFAEAYRLQAKAWLRSIEEGRSDPGAATAWDGYCAAAIAEAGVRALTDRRQVEVEMAEKPAFYRSEEFR